VCSGLCAALAFVAAQRIAPCQILGKNDSTDYYGRHGASDDGATQINRQSSVNLTL
jgi:hypothetical protein